MIGGGGEGGGGCRGAGEATLLSSSCLQEVKVLEEEPCPEDLGR